MSRRTLREGFSTGTAAAAAAAAAALRLCGEQVPPSLSVALPPFDLAPGGIAPRKEQRLATPVAFARLEKDGAALALVVKDGGDDPDATNGARITALVSRRPPEGGAAPIRLVHKGRGICLYGGGGVGRVTLPGLPVAVGEAAINPEPRKQIAFAVAETADAHGLDGDLHVEIRVEDGENMARRTLNARLGILGGISILGTHGTVRPYSHEAWTECIRQGLNVAAALGLTELLLATGRRSERLGFALYPHLPPQAGVQAADYAAFTLRAAASFSRLHWLCFPGKLLKLAQGLEWTHAKSAPADLGLLARLAGEAGADAATRRRLAAMPTAAGAFALLEERPELHAAALDALARTALGVMRRWLDEAAQPGCGRPELRLHVFHPDGRRLLALPPENAAPGGTTGEQSENRA